MYQYHNISERLVKNINFNQEKIFINTYQPIQKNINVKNNNRLSGHFINIGK